ncbi:hypothetical protein GCK72_003332 [Caenorhabditis remanei]|uniref:Uncharacterized protein n=1 Tax=Caenorhabditis remanei TaxID=31234 RepID=A0A6A5HV39_CAERE|nr:hypothetical protein GCK72_003332 [Caenorhabditis remanei]KAF1771505.1 hypothetical protein GCK72_003332 [Caenorhabditis remanei]
MRWLGSLWKAPGGILQKRLDHNFDRPAAATSTNTRHSDLVRVMATLSLSGLSMKSGSAAAVPSGVLFLSPALSDEWKDLEREVRMITRSNSCPCDASMVPTKAGVSSSSLATYPAWAL